MRLNSGAWASRLETLWSKKNRVVNTKAGTTAIAIWVPSQRLRSTNHERPAKVGLGGNTGVPTSTKGMPTTSLILGRATKPVIMRMAAWSVGGVLDGAARGGARTGGGGG